MQSLCKFKASVYRVLGSVATGLLLVGVACGAAATATPGLYGHAPAHRGPGGDAHCRAGGHADPHCRAHLRSCCSSDSQPG